MNPVSVNFAIEKGFRLLKEQTLFFHFFMIQFRLDKAIIPDGSYRFYLKNNKNDLIYKKEIFINSKKNCIITHGSHEDPLVQTDNEYLICFQIDSDLLPNLEKNLLTYLSDNKDNIIASVNLPDLSSIYAKYKQNHYSEIINQQYILSKKDCILTLHLGDENANYHEETFFLKADNLFDFGNYIEKYCYLGVQCSYENELPEIEEKHIVIGQKGIFLSGVAHINGKKIMPPIDFQEYYQKNIPLNDLTKVNSIKDLITYYQQSNTSPKFFESQVPFLLTAYLKYSTYNQDGLYSDALPPLKAHTELEVCQQCPKAAYCLQVIPSGLSSSLFRKNIVLEEHKNCEIYKLLDVS